MMTKSIKNPKADFDSQIVALFNKESDSSATTKSTDSAAQSVNRNVARPKRKTHGIAFSLVALGLIGTGIHLAPREAAVDWVQTAAFGTTSTDTPQIETTSNVATTDLMPSVQPAGPAIAKASEVVFSGYIVAHDPVAASLQVEGIVTELLVDIGTQVQSGQVLARLDHASADLAIETAQLELEAAQGNVAAATLAAREAEIVVDRARALQVRQVVSDVAVSTAEFSEDTARMKVTQANIDVRRYEINLSRQIALRAQHEIIAPQSGVISERNLNIGAWHQPGNYAVCGSICSAFVIIDPTRLQVEGEVTESRLSNIVIGGTVVFQSVADPSVTATGRIERISPSVSREKATFKVIIAFDDMDVTGFAPNVAVKISTSSSLEKGTGQ